MADGGDGQTVVQGPWEIADPIENEIYAPPRAEAMLAVTDLLKEREKTHGPYDVKARTIQQFKDVARATANWNKLSYEQAESLDMIFHKIGRILAGDPNFPDHWEDVKGYAELIARELRRNGRGH